MIFVKIFIKLSVMIVVHLYSLQVGDDILSRFEVFFVMQSSNFYKKVVSEPYPEFSVESLLVADYALLRHT